MLHYIYYDLFLSSWTPMEQHCKINYIPLFTASHKNGCFQRPAKTDALLHFPHVWNKHLAGSVVTNLGKVWMKREVKKFIFPAFVMQIHGSAGWKSFDPNILHLGVRCQPDFGQWWCIHANCKLRFQKFPFPEKLAFVRWTWKNKHGFPR